LNNVKKSIGWADFTINPVKGLCPVDCKDNQGKSYCYAAGERGLYKRFKWNPKIRLDKEVPIYGFPPSSKVFIGSTIELFGDWIKKEWLKYIFANVRQNPDVTFIFLTKQPLHLPKEFPENCWVGVSATNQQQFDNAVKYLKEVEATVKYISFEPLLGRIQITHIDLHETGISWVIIGAQTPFSIKTVPKIEWVNEIVEAADKAGIPVFQKDNLKPLFTVGLYTTWWGSDDGYGVTLRQEFPSG